MFRFELSKCLEVIASFLEDFQGDIILCCQGDGEGSGDSHGERVLACFSWPVGASLQSMAFWLDVSGRVRANYSGMKTEWVGWIHSQDHWMGTDLAPIHWNENMSIVCGIPT